MEVSAKKDQHITRQERMDNMWEILKTIISTAYLEPREHAEETLWDEVEDMDKAL